MSIVRAIKWFALAGVGIVLSGCVVPADSQVSVYDNQYVAPTYNDAGTVTYDTAPPSYYYEPAPVTYVDPYYEYVPPRAIIRPSFGFSFYDYKDHHHAHKHKRKKAKKRAHREEIRKAKREARREAREARREARSGDRPEARREERRETRHAERRERRADRRAARLAECQSAGFENCREKRRAERAAQDAQNQLAIAKKRKRPANRRQRQINPDLTK